MSTDRNTERIVRSWLRTGQHESADRVLDAVLDRLDTTPQRRATWPARRLSAMNTFAKIAFAAAAVVVVAFVGYQFLGVGTFGRNVGGAQAMPIATPSVTAQPTPTPMPFPLGGPNLTPGRQVIDEPFPVRITLDVPEGWFSWISNSRIAGLIVDNGVGDGASGWGVTFWIVDNVYADPCDPLSELDPPLGPSVDDLAAALTSLPGYEATTPSAITLSGFEGVEFQLTAPMYGEDCPNHRTWSTIGNEPRGMLPGETNRIRILDVDGVRLLILTTEYAHTTELELSRGIPYDANAHAADQPELQRIIDSLRIESPGPG